MRKSVVRKSAQESAQSLVRTEEASEAKDLAREMARVRDGYVRWHSSAYDMPLSESVLVTGEESKEYVKRLVEQAGDRPADQITWYELDHLAGEDATIAADQWRRIKEEAREELECGWRASRAVETDRGNQSPWDRARFLAVRQALRDDWQPRCGTESMLVDMLAQIHWNYEAWLGRHVHRMAYTGIGVTREEKEYRSDRGQYITPRVTEHEEVEQTAQMCDRWQKAYLRTVRALRDLRRHAPVVIQNAGQVNIGEQQVNLGVTN